MHLSTSRGISLEENSISVGVDKKIYRSVDTLHLPHTEVLRAPTFLLSPAYGGVETSLAPLTAYTGAEAPCLCSFSWHMSVEASFLTYVNTEASYSRHMAVLKFPAPQYMIMLKFFAPPPTYGHSEAKPYRGANYLRHIGVD